MNTKILDGLLFAKMLHMGGASLQEAVEKINDLNVFPIPDGDTGDNMMMTLVGGVNCGENPAEELSVAASKASDGMLLSARGNSGVILSQFFEGLALGFNELSVADCNQIMSAFKSGVDKAYEAVSKPTEGTMLTVMREATEYVSGKQYENVYSLLTDFIEGAKISLSLTPDKLPVLKEAGVVDSGGAGFVCILEGMREAFGTDKVKPLSFLQSKEEVNVDLFTEDSVLEFGYCTELLIRLQKSKTDIENFEIEKVVEYLNSIGDSVAAFKTGSAVKVHVHTFTPYKVLEYCQGFGEFLKIKIENMSLQHNNTISEEKPAEKRERRKYGVVSVCSGEGVKEAFTGMGSDMCIEGGQSMNPSTEDFIKAFDYVNADYVFVLPNNSNVILTAKQAGGMYEGSEIRVIESKNIGEGYAAISMLDTNMESPEEIEQSLNTAMEDVLTCEVSCCVRDASFDGVKVNKGDYIGFMGKSLLSHSDNRKDAAIQATDKLDFENHEIFILIYGKDANEEEARLLTEYVRGKYPYTEVFMFEGGQEIYDYIMIAE